MDRCIKEDERIKNIMVSQNKKFIALSVPEIAGNEWTYVKECLDTGWVSSAGPFVKKFEQHCADYIGRKYAVACTSATAGLHTALMILDVKPDEEVIVPDLTFAAPAFAVRYVGAWPLFVDVEEKYFQIDPEKIKDFLTRGCIYKNGQCTNRKTRRRVRALLPVHLLGHPVEMKPLMALAKKYDLAVVEDVAESLGALCDGKKVGTLGDIAVLSFNGNKIITAGGGGMLLTDSKILAKKASYLTTQAKDDPIESIHNTIGYNYRLNNLQAALGLAQFEKLDAYIEKKNAIAQNYTQALKKVCGLHLPQQAPWARSIWWLYTVLVDKQKYGVDARALMKVFELQNIQTRPLWHPLHSLKAFQGCMAYKIEKSLKLYQQALSLPSSVGMTTQEQERVIEILCATVKK